MKPVARLHIIKQREYRKTQCQGNRGVGNRGIVNPSWNMNNPNFGGSENNVLHILNSFLVLSYPLAIHL